MINIENIFKEVCEINMVEFDLEEFKKDYPKLYGCIIGAMVSTYSQGVQNERLKGNLIDEEAISKRVKEEN